jgi:FkbM family methyltransferase
MIEIVPNPPGGGTAPPHIDLGAAAAFDVVAADSAVEVRVFVQQQAVRYLKPLGDWSAPGRVVFRPEAPGAYTLAVEWRRPDGAHGWRELPFQVGLGGWSRAAPSNAPRQVEAAGGVRLWTPSEWEAAIFAAHEEPVRALLPGLVRPGGIAYDIGANIGYYAVTLARLVGPRGHVFAIEANPLCVYFLRANLEANGVGNCTILPAALLNEDASVEFTINYGNCHLGLSERSDFYHSKMGHDVAVHGHPLDRLIEGLALPPPAFVKMDIEGGEGPAMQGMRATVERHRPTLLVEIHGRAAARATVAPLAGLGYRYRDAESGTAFADAAALLAWFPEAVRQIVCTPAA